jgi:regulator of protease activity HflC (stomatin/prohibitin superfamily)
MEILIFLIFMALAVSIIASKAIVITKEGERLVVFRLGELFRVCPPGRTILIPYIDKSVSVRVDEIAGWQTMPESELQLKVAQAVINKSA